MYTSRRQILLSGGASLVGLASGLGPRLSRAADRPVLTHGLQSAMSAPTSAVVWARSDRPARAIVEWATTESFSDIRGGVFADALPETDGTVKVALTGLPAGQDVFYPVRLQDIAAPTIVGPAQIGRFRTAPGGQAHGVVLLVGRHGGPGLGHRRGPRRHDDLLGHFEEPPDFFIHSGDTIYADGPIQSEVKLPDGSLWRNRVTEEVAKPAETLAEFRGRHKYNLTDRNVLR